MRLHRLGQGQNPVQMNLELTSRVKIEEIVGQDIPVIRSMPNTAISVGHSMTCISANEQGKEKIEAAKEAWRAGDWEHGRFQLPPNDRDEFIPLP